MVKIKRHTTSGYPAMHERIELRKKKEAERKEKEKRYPYQLWKN